LIPLTPYPAALIKSKDEKILVIADLHIGWEIALSQKGIHIPTQTSRMLRKLLKLISIYNPNRLLILGDVKHTIAMAELGEWQDVPNFFEALKKRVKRISIIPGNHDGNLEPLLPENIEILSSSGTAIDEVGLFHGHKWPSPALLKCKILMMGHVHPVIAFRDPTGFRITRQVWVKVNCKREKLIEILLKKRHIKIEKSPEETLRKHFKVTAKVSQLFIMPSFNEYLGGKPLNEGMAEKTRIVGPILRSETVDIENAEVYLLDGTYIGKLSQLKTLIR